MTIRQISVFLENKTGALQGVLDALKAANIQIIASTLADTIDFGIYRIICSEPAKAYNVLKNAGIAATFSDVFAVELEDKPGMAANAMEIFAREDISISYLYSFLLGGKGVLIFRTDDTERAREIIILEQLKAITEEQLHTLAKE